jgi:hypothetical protein
MRDIGFWEVGLNEDNEPHIHYCVPASVHKVVAPTALLRVLYEAASTITAYLAEHMPWSPYLVQVNPYPSLHREDKVIYGCICFVPATEAGVKYIEKNPATPRQFEDVLHRLAESFQDSAEYFELLEPRLEEETEGVPQQNAPGSPTIN